VREAGRRAPQPLAPAVRSPAPRRTLALTAIVLAFSVIAVDNVMVTGAAPSIAGALAGLELVGWLFTAYLLTWTVTIPLYGKLADLHGRRPILLVGLGLFLLGSVLAALAQSMEQLIACRLLQGLGTGAIQPVAHTAAGDLFPPHRRVQAQLLFSIAYLVVSVVGPVLAGGLIMAVSWRAVFLVEAALALLGAVLLALLLTERVERPSHYVDWRGAGLLMLGAGALLVALARATRGEDWLAPAQLVLYAVAAVAWPLFFWQETRAPEPLLPLSLLQHRLIRGSYLVTLVVGGTIAAFGPFVPLFVQGVLELGPTEAGLVALPFNGAWLVTNAVAGPLFWHFGYRLTCALGLGIIAAGYLALLLPARDPLVAYGVIVGALLVLGGGVGLVNTASIVAVQNAVPWGSRGIATSGHQFCRFLGASLLLSLVSTVVNTRLAGELAVRGVEALPTSPGAAAASRIAQASALLTPESRAALAPETLTAMQQALDSTLREAYLLVAAVGVLGALLALLLPGGRAEVHVWQEPERPVAPERLPGERASRR